MPPAAGQLQVASTQHLMCQGQDCRLHTQRPTKKGLDCFIDKMGGDVLLQQLLNKQRGIEGAAVNAFGC